MGRPNQAEQIPPAVSVGVLPPVGVKKVSVKPVPDELIIEFDGVVSRYAGSGPGELPVNFLDELVFG